MTPRITVAIPTYNRSDMLSEALESVLSQSLGDLEVVVLDNASTDDTRSVVAEFRDPRIRYFRHEQEISRPANFSLCLKTGTAPYVTMLCDDDMMLPDNLEKKVRFLEEHAAVGLVDSAFRIIGPHGEVLRERGHFGMGDADFVCSGDEFITRSFAETFRITTFTLIRRSVIERECFEAADGPSCDFGLFLRLATRTNVAFIAEPLAVLRMHGGAETVHAGMSELASGAYEETLEKIALDQRIKSRFLERFGAEVRGSKALRSASRSWARNQSLTLVGRKVVTGAPRATTLRMLGDACRIEPSVILSGRAWKLLGGSLLGSAGRALHGRMRGSARASTLQR